MWTPKTILLSACLLCAPGWSAEFERTSSQPIENTLGMKFVLVPAGEFMMGSDESPEALARAYPQYDPKRFLELGDEAPVHRVRITRPFYLGSTK